MVILIGLILERRENGAFPREARRRTPGRQAVDEQRLR
jgi:hypothetical protein